MDKPELDESLHDFFVDAKPSNACSRKNDNEFENISNRPLFPIKQDSETTLLLRQQAEYQESCASRQAFKPSDEFILVFRSMSLGEMSTHSATRTPEMVRRLDQGASGDGSEGSPNDMHPYMVIAESLPEEEGEGPREEEADQEDIDDEQEEVQIAEEQNQDVQQQQETEEESPKENSQNAHHEDTDPTPADEASSDPSNTEEKESTSKPSEYEGTFEEKENDYEQDVENDPDAIDACCYYEEYLKEESEKSRANTANSEHTEKNYDGDDDFEEYESSAPSSSSNPDEDDKRPSDSSRTTSKSEMDDNEIVKPFRQHFMKKNNMVSDDCEKSRVESGERKYNPYRDEQQNRAMMRLNRKSTEGSNCVKPMSNERNKSCDGRSRKGNQQCLPSLPAKSGGPNCHDNGRLNSISGQGKGKISLKAKAVLPAIKPTTEEDSPRKASASNYSAATTLNESIRSYQRPSVPVMLKSDACFREGRLEVTITTEDELYEAVSQASIKLTLVHTRQSRYRGPSAYLSTKRKKKKAKQEQTARITGLRTEPNRNVIDQRAQWPPFNTHTNPEASKRFQAIFQV